MAIYVPVTKLTEVVNQTSNSRHSL